MARSNSLESVLSSSSEVFFDCLDISSPSTSKTPLVRWSSELLETECDSPRQKHSLPEATNIVLLIMIFQNDAYPEVNDFYFFLMIIFYSLFY